MRDDRTMTTPRTLDSVKRAAERAGEIRYEHRRRAVEEAAKHVPAAQPEPEAQAESHADE